MARQLHVMQVINSLVQGGSERLACDLALRLDPSRFRSSIGALEGRGSLAGTLNRAGIPCYVAGCAPGFDWRLIARLYRLFRETRVDVVQTHHIKQLVYAGVSARLAGAALVHVEHEYFSLRSPKARRCLRVLAPLCHRVVAVGEELRRFLLREARLPPTRVSVIPNGVDVTRYSPQQRVSGETFGFALDGPLIGHVARLEIEKDQSTLLRSFRIVVDTCPGARLVIVGDGSRRGDLEQTARSLGIAERVNFLGFREDVADLLPHLDVFVLSSSNEGLPLALLEAMACARPVVATAVGEIPHVIRDGVTGVIVPPGDPQALATAIRAILERPEWGTALGYAGRRLVEERFALTLLVERYQALYGDQLGAAHRGLPRRAASAGTHLA